VVAGYFIAFWKVSNIKSPENHRESNLISNLKEFFISFSPILATIIVVAALGSVGFNLSKQGFNVLIATIGGILILIIISKANSKVLAKPLKNRGIYGIILQFMEPFC
jgi:uncharacterized membrane protein